MLTASLLLLQYKSLNVVFFIPSAVYVAQMNAKTNLLLPRKLKYLFLYLSQLFIKLITNDNRMESPITSIILSSTAPLSLAEVCIMYPQMYSVANTWYQYSRISLIAIDLTIVRQDQMAKGIKVTEHRFDPIWVYSE